MLTIVWDTDLLIKICNDSLPNVDLRQLSKENEFVVLPGVIQEIKGLTKSESLRTSRRAQMTLRVMKEMPLFKEQSTRHDDVSSRIEMDERLIEFVKKKPEDRILGTLDGTLLSRMEKLGLPYLTLSKGKLYVHAFARATYLTKRRK
jgi:rRNA-processing protein FCF1